MWSASAILRNRMSSCSLRRVVFCVGRLRSCRRRARRWASGIERYGPPSSKAILLLPFMAGHERHGGRVDSHAGYSPSTFGPAVPACCRSQPLYRRPMFNSLTRMLSVYSVSISQHSSRSWAEPHFGPHTHGNSAQSSNAGTGGSNVFKPVNFFSPVGRSAKMPAAFFIPQFACATAT